MPTVTKTNARKLPDPPFDGVPYGNAAKLHYSFATDASGVMVDSDSAVAVADGDKVILGVIPAGMKLIDSLTIISDGFTALTTADIGFEYMDGVDDPDVPQDADYFNAALDTAAAGRSRAANSAVAPVVLPKNAFLTLTIGGASHGSAGRLDIIVEGILTGRK